MKLEEVTEKIIRIIKKAESCGWSDRSGICSKDCPLWNLTEPGEYCDTLAYLKNEEIKEFSERITNIFREEYSEEMKEQSDDVVVSEDKKETTIDDVVEYLKEMTSNYGIFCKNNYCKKCNLNSANSNNLCLFLSALKDDVENGNLKKADKILKYGNIRAYPDPNIAIISFVQNKIRDAESENEKCEYQEILEKLTEEV